MSNSKRLLALLLALVMVFLVACSGGQSTDPDTETPTEGETSAEGETPAEGEEPASDIAYQDEYTYAGTNALATMDYVNTSYSADHAFNANFVDGLLENDRYGAHVPSLAESFESNEDSTVWTFKLRPDVKWVTSNQEEYATLVAEDFVTGLRHAAEFESNVNWLLQGVIAGYSEYLESDYSDAAWENVGIKAVDEMTVEYTLETPTPFFADITTYNILMPINREFLEGQGQGCVLGSPNPDDCTFGSTDPNTILYNGAYVLESFDQASSIVMSKNELYWDVENVFLNKITEIYDNGEDPYSIKNGFEQGTYPAMSIRPTWENYAEIRAEYEEYVRESQPNASTFGVMMNFNRGSFEQTNYASDETLRANTNKAINNLNFRKAFQAAYDRVAYLSVSAPENLAKATLRNINNYADAAVHSDGRNYTQLVTDAYKELTGEDVDLSDGQDPWLNKDKALEYIEAAKAEGIEFPVHLDYLVIETSDTLVKQANSLKQSVEANTDGQIIIEIVMRDQDTVYNIAYYNEDPAGADYDISTFSGWGPDYNDPLSFAQIMSPTEGSYMINLGLGTSTIDDNDQEVISNLEIKEALGMMDYEELYQAAKAETSDLDKRYELFAQADALLVANKLYLPGQMQTRSEQVSKMEPLQGPYSLVGLAEYKFKGRKLREELVTKAEYDQIRADWEATRAEVLSQEH